MTEQLSIVPKIDPDELVARVRAEHRPVASVALFSGGNDSTVLAHRCREHYDSLAFIDTGTAIPGVREFVVEFAAWLDKPLRIFESGSCYREMVLGIGNQWREGKAPLGFPGPAQHNRAYNQLKEQRLRELRADLQAGVRGAKVMMLTGVRRSESQRRKQRQPVAFHGAIVFVNPLIDWTGDQMRAYRAEHALPQSDVAALLHRSGECNCGAFAAQGEREMLQALYPDWFEQTIAALEREAEAAGIPACRWGERPGEPVAGGALCSDCQLRLEAPETTTARQG